MKDKLAKLYSPELCLTHFCNAVKELPIEEIKEAILLEMLEVNRIYGTENKLEIMENGLPIKNTPARLYHDDLIILLSFFGKFGQSKSRDDFTIDCRKIPDKFI